MTNPGFPLSTLPIAEDELRQRAAAELARRGWLLAEEPALFVPGDTFVRRVAARLLLWCNEQQRLLDDALILRAIAHEYCHLLHAAVSTDGSRQQNIALQETMNYGWPIARKHRWDVTMAESAILRAVNQTWLTIHRCEPGLYLAYFVRILLNEINQARRKDKSRSSHFPPAPEPIEGDDDEDATLASTWRDLAAEADFEQLLRREAMPSLQQVLRKCLRNARQEHIILLHFFAELNPSEVAQHLQIKVQQFSVEKSRALTKIRARCLEELQRELSLRLSLSF